MLTFFDILFFLIRWVLIIGGSVYASMHCQSYVFDSITHQLTSNDMAFYTSYAATIIGGGLIGWVAQAIVLAILNSIFGSYIESLRFQKVNEQSQKMRKQFFDSASKHR